MKLNIGSAKVRIGDFLNLDIRPGRYVDIVEDVTKLKTIEDDSCSAIIAHNILEHIAPDKIKRVLSLWVRKLNRDGWLEVGVPDAQLIFNRFQANFISRKEYDDAWDDLVHSLLGNMKLLRKWHGADAEKYMHHMVFNKAHLDREMSRAGLKHREWVKSNHRDNITMRGYKKKP